MRKILLLLTLATSALASSTQIVDLLYSTGTTTPPPKFSGTVTVSWSAFTDSSGLVHPRGQLQYRVSNGVLNLYLVANAGSTPTGSSYRVQYSLANGLPMAETWVVPVSGSPVTLATIRTTPTPPITWTTLNASSLTGTLQAAQFPALTGDITTTAGSLATTLSNSGVSAGTYGDSTHVGVFTVNAKGRITAASNVLISGGGGSGTVTSVGFTGGIISIANPTTTPAFTVAGTSGGVPYFSSSSAWASSAALAIHGVVIGGGAGGAPTSTAAGTAGQVLTSNGASADPTFQTVTGTGTVTTTGTMTVDALVTSNSGTVVKTPSATATLDSSGNISTPGNVSVGVGTSTGGSLTWLHGTTSDVGTVAANSFALFFNSANSDRPSVKDSSANVVPLTQTIASGAKALATSAIASEACATDTFTATGTLTSDTVSATFASDPSGVTGYVPLVAGGLTIYVWPTADTVNIKTCNFSSSSISPGAISLNLKVVR